MEDITVFEYLGHKYAIARITNDFGWMTDYDRSFYRHDSEGKHTRTPAEFNLEDFHWTGGVLYSQAVYQARKQIDTELALEEAMQSIYDDKDDGQYAILYEGFHSGHKYMVVEDQLNDTIGYATDLDQDLRGLAPDFSRFHFGFDIDDQAIRAARTEIDHWLSPVTDNKPKEEVTMGATEEKEVIEAKRVMSWAIIKLTQSIEHLRDLCKRKEWDDEITYDMEEAKTKLGECLADLTVWDEESFEKGSKND